MVKTESFILELKLNTSIDDKRILDKRFSISEHMYNATLKYAKKQLKRMRENKFYKKTLQDYLNSKDIKEKKEISKILTEIRKSYNLTDYGLQSFINKQIKMYSKNIDSNTGQKIATTVYKAVQTVLFEDGKNLHFKKVGTLTSVEGKTNKSGIKFIDNNLIWNKLIIPVKIRNNDLFAKECLEHKIKFCRIVKKPFKSGNKYFLQLVLEGTPPPKRFSKTGEFKCPISPNKEVGLDIGTSSLAICSNIETKLLELAKDSNKYNKQIINISKRLDWSRRQTNPNNYNENGIIKCGVKLIWHRSKGYMRLFYQLKNLYRLKTIYVKMEHNKLSNYILSLGNIVYVETMNFKALQKRSKKTEISEKTGKFKRKKRFGKSLNSKSPATFLTILDSKLKYQQKQLNKVNTIKFRASQYNHVDDTYVKKSLSTRTKNINGDIIQRDLYSAFLLMNSNKIMDQADRNLCIQNYDIFKINHDKCINELKNSQTKLLSSFGI